MVHVGNNEPLRNMTDTNSVIYERNALSTHCEGLIDSQVINKAGHKKLQSLNSFMFVGQQPHGTAWKRGKKERKRDACSSEPRIMNGCFEF